MIQANTELLPAPEMTDTEITDTAVPVRLRGLVRVPCPLCNCATSRPETVIAGYSLEKCNDCGLIYMNPRCTADHLADIYTVRDEDSLIELYSRIASPSVLEDYNQKLAKIERMVPGKGRFLDFACAAGYLFEEAQKRGWDAHGCDVGEWTGRAAEKRHLQNMHVGDFDDLNFPDNHFDVVYASQVFEHLLYPLEDLARLKRVLKPGGLLYIEVPNYNTLPIRFGKDDFMLNEPPQHINYFTPTTLRKVLTDGGMERITMTSCGGLKWENLLGRPIISDVAAAYGLVDDRSGTASRPSLLSRCPSTAKQLAKSTVIEPLLYNGAKIGMNLLAYSRKPSHV
ncbi:MAG: class I SAM-dependent methyltransferase [Planctomycetaceae bacterium]